jgi:hypothetical protein
MVSQSGEFPRLLHRKVTQECVTCRTEEVVGGRLMSLTDHPSLVQV